MRIVTLISSLGAGGTERAAENYSIGYRAAGTDVIVLTNRGGERAESLRRAGVPVLIAGTGANWENAMRTVEDWNPDIIHVHRHRATAESSAILERLQGRRRRIIETNVFARFDSSPVGKLIDISLQLSRWCLWKWSRWSSRGAARPVGTVLPYAIDCSRFAPPSPLERSQARQAVNIPEDAFVFGRVGQPMDGKWSHAMLAAFEKIAAKYFKAHLLVVGMPASLMRTLNSLPIEVRRRVVSIPFVQGDSCLRDCYGAMDCFLHVAEQGESFGYVLCEAMSCGLPVITLSRPARDNSQVEVVGHLRGGLVAATKRDLGSAMELLLLDEDLRFKLAGSAPDWVRSRFDLRAVMPRLLRLCEISLACDSRAEISRGLEAEGYITGARWAELRRTLNNCIGKPSKVDLLVSKVAHMPAVYGTYRALRHSLQ
jgi:glycosyltransferase involved in cell wall biosynthesis